jgi:hypothetical protein
MENSFKEFNNHLQLFIWEMNNFSYITAREIWPEKDYNNVNKNHFWEKFLECDRSPALFYSRLDIYNRKKLYDYIICVTFQMKGTS